MAEREDKKTAEARALEGDDVEEKLGRWSTVPGCAGGACAWTLGRWSVDTRAWSLVNGSGMDAAAKRVGGRDSFPKRA
ncbi:hypothetical protein ACRE_074130 [Hapsidospora chrysogenum ATCC 11550]|uniref:Uncharacterized protein n=1 Tax=Hapsidospora chrysogenum (strain ATCC 11550 / CBS 779.69 / DSM 880 / IAM 14645 / JCM 23072 / IMI 49137) TaxID=857340 RepID=A0A086SXM1_HAPC1|nr:hypothetical protein ACRE_074130 [Hapsidospora chrysogenum ATCC 11550]